MKEKIGDAITDVMYRNPVTGFLWYMFCMTVVFTVWCWWRTITKHKYIKAD